MFIVYNSKVGLLWRIQLDCEVQVQDYYLYIGRSFLQFSYRYLVKRYSAWTVCDNNTYKEQNQTIFILNLPSFYEATRQL